MEGGFSKFAQTALFWMFFFQSFFKLFENIGRCPVFLDTLILGFNKITTQPTFTCSKLPIETLE